MFGDGKERCPVCGRLWGHLTGCQIPNRHAELEELITAAMSRGYKIEDLMVEVIDRHA